MTSGRILVLSKTTLMKGSLLDAGASMEIAPSPSDWLGTPRYEVRARIGSGGMGAVYEAFDHEKGQLVAVKTLLRFSPAALYRFKQEFRTLADVVHPNLVHLYELVATDADHVFFAMELVRGVDFLVHGLGPEGASRARIARPTTRRSTGGPWTDADRTAPHEAVALPPPPGPVTPTPADLPRLRAGLRQLVAGVSALHAAGKLHRDIKPSNVLVTSEGRIVLLDFGVAADLSRARHEGAGEREVVGTARYMAPEQALNEAPSPASDWYSVGAMLYEVLVGRSPFSGSSVEVLARKSLVEAQAPSECVTGVPDDLDSLCVALLRREPRARPGDEEIVRWLDGRRVIPRRSPVPAPVARAAAATAATPLIGRGAEQRALLEALDAARLGRKLVTVRVHGSAGMGASALVQHFVGALAERGEAILLQGRAYARESMPYKALDSMIDALSRYLMRRAVHDPSMQLPRDIAALAQLFPVLSRVERVHDAPLRPAPGPMTVRRRAINALRELVAQISTRQPLVLWVDDAQWGDVDSAELVLELVSQPLAAPALLVLTYRDEEEDASPFLVETRRRWPLGADVRDVALGHLASEDARQLAHVLLAASGHVAADETAESIAHESGGSPLLVEELARSVARGSTAPLAPRGVVRLESVVAARMATLPADARRLLELLALCARPLPLTIVGDAAGLYEPLDDTIAALRTGRFVRTGFRDGREVVEMLHDRVREMIVAQLAGDTMRDYHWRLARVLEPVPGVDTEALATHLLGAGERARAAKYAGRAAEQAAAKLAFGQAIRLYRLEIEILGEASVEARRVQVRLAEVLERSGRGLEAARVYQAAAARARGFERMELEREAAGQLLHTGHLHEGDAALGRILAAAGMRRPRTIFGALLWWIFYRAALVLSGSRWLEREVYDVRPVDHLQIEAMHMLVVGLSFTNVLHGVCMQPRHLFLALRAGDRFQVLRAAGIESLNASARGGTVGRREQVFGEIVERMAAKIDDTDSRAFNDGTRAVRRLFHGDWREAGDGLNDAIERYGTAPAGWLSNARLFSIYCLVHRGRLAELRLHHAARLAEAEERGDLYVSVNLRIGLCNSVWLLADDADAARRHLREAMAAWKEEGFSLQHYRAFLAEANIELYGGAGQAAHDVVMRGWPLLRRSLFLYVQFIRGDAYSLRARCALASGRVAEAARFARKLDRERVLWMSTVASLVWSGIARASGDREGEIGHLRAAAERAESGDMQLHAAVARMRLGAILGAGEGEELEQRARAWMAEQGVARPDRIAAMYAPLAPTAPVPATRVME
jgi:eukaryotic-like serine/threonine-protein kinase